jgi:soluble lytic murein transglycosylase-like protein
VLARCSITAIAAVAAAFASSEACAQVFEIGPEGVAQISPKIEAPSPGALAHDQTPTQVSRSAKAKLASVQPMLTTAGAAVDLSPRLVEAVAFVESRFGMTATSPAGAVGAMQLMPGTAKDLGVDALNPEQNIRGGAAYLKQMLQMFGGNVELALAAYNAGPAAVRKHNGVPPYPETQAYVAAVLDYLAHASLEDEES